MALRHLVPVYGRRQPLRGQDISRRIDVAIVAGTAATAYPCPYPQPIDACGSRSGVTVRTGAAGVSFINDLNASTGVLAFIQKLRFQDSPPQSSTDLAIRVLTSFRELTSPMTIFWYVLTTLLEN